jgi:hypothetical protein
MSTIAFRPDYAKFTLELPRGLFHQYYEALNRASHETKFHGDWLKSHNVQALPSMDPSRETTVIEIWGEWTGIVRSMPFPEWGRFLRRFDVRGIVWDADGDAVLAVGQRLQRANCRYNVECFSSKPASKRKGRDRGGKGFRIGSRKSDVCLVVYKRAGEPVAQEYRMQAQVLRNMVSMTIRAQQGVQEVVDMWQMLIDRCSGAGQKRLNGVLEQAGIGTYWPTYAQEGRDDYDQVQTSFAAPIDETLDEAQHLEWYLYHYDNGDTEYRSKA